MLFSHAIFVPTTTAPTIISNSIVGGETQGPHWTVTTVRVTLSECVRIKQPKRRRWHLRSGVLVVSEAAEGRLGKFGKRKAMRNSETLRISSLLLLLLHLVSGSSVFCYAHTKTALSQPKSFAVSVRALGFREMSGGSSGMEVYDVSETRNHDADMIEGADLNSHFTSPNIERTEVMINEGAPEFFVDQNLYYPAATNYGYYCSGFGTPGEQEDQHRIFGVDGPNIQFTGAQNESFPYVYYSYGYAQSPYNPYNPYIPGAMIGADGSFGGGQHYYTLPNYQSPVSAPGYIPLVQPDNFSDSSADSFFGASASVSKPDGRGLKPKFNSASGNFSRNSSIFLSNQTSSLARASERPRANDGRKQGLTHASVSGSSFLNLASPAVHQSAVAKLRPKLHIGKAVPNGGNGSSDVLGEQNRGPRVGRSKHQLSVKAYTTMAGDGNEQGNIVIYPDQYNMEDFPLGYENAKFFVIKSYSEDDVHKSIKYNVWSSTPHGNKKLENAYEDAKKIAAEKSEVCPIFLLFSVNASGQFCGVAEMVGTVDFSKNMDFWQQDKWSGSFPVKWHIIKDVPNPNFRHIILENNENKPVTNSRDAQEIMYLKGLEMLKIFKNHTLKTSLLDDFMYYENRQKIMQDEKAKFLVKSFDSPIFVPVLEAPQKLNFFVDVPTDNYEKNLKPKDDSDGLKHISFSSPEQIVGNSDVTGIKHAHDEKDEKIAVDKEHISSILKIGSVTIAPKQVEAKQSVSNGNKEPVDVLTVGSMQVKVNGFPSSSGFLKVGSTPFDARALQPGKGDAAVKSGSQR
ncbi:YTH domain family protein 2 [Glycine soja]|nr:YTH domain family protein 2 [Glycine soja]